ncbi:unnamed protein product, partial [marine sediment metagenome]
IHNEALEPEDFIGIQYLVELPVYAINGHITDSSSGEGLPGTVVTADPGNFAVVTDSNGDFTIDLPMEGEFTVSINKSNYTSTSEQGVVVAADVPVTLNAALESLSLSPIIADYHFDGDGKDASVNGYDLIVNDVVTWTDGIQGKAAVLDSLYEKTPGIMAFETSTRGLIYPGNGDITCEILMDIHEPEGAIPNFGFGNHSYGFSASWYKSEYKIHVYLVNDDGRLEITIPGDDYISEWTHFAIVYRYKQSCQLYINGELIAEQETDLVPAMYPREP